MNKKKNILLVDDHSLVRNGIKMMLEKNSEIAQITEACNGKDAVNLCNEKDYDMVFMDINMPELNGIDATEIILKMKPNTKIVCLSMHNEYSYVSKMLALGAYGYLIKDCDPEEFSLAIKAVSNNQKYYSRGVTDILINKHLNADNVEKNKKLNDISEREIEVLKYVVEGLTNAEIGAKLFLSTRTIDSHRRNILKKSNCANTPALVKFALENKLI